MSEALTEGIQVQVKPEFWPERSVPEKGQWAFTYTVTITNTGTRTATLISRHWLIADANGRVEEVRGEGVVGKQPRLEPGSSFEYTSYVMLRTPFGSMRGSYLMRRVEGGNFEAKIPEFPLTQRHALH